MAVVGRVSVQKRRLSGRAAVTPYCENSLSLLSVRHRPVRLGLLLVLGLSLLSLSHK